MNKTTWYQRKISLDDGTVISIICTEDISYGHADKLFECALVAPDGSIDDEKLKGYLDFDQVAEYIKNAKEQHNDKTR
jgi:hypothetical protein